MLTICWLCGKISWLPSHGGLLSHAESGIQRSGHLGLVIRTSRRQTKQNHQQTPGHACPSEGRRVTRTDDGATTAPPHTRRALGLAPSPAEGPRAASTTHGTEDTRTEQTRNAELRHRPTRTAHQRLGMFSWSLRYVAPFESEQTHLF